MDWSMSLCSRSSLCVIYVILDFLQRERNFFFGWLCDGCFLCGLLLFVVVCVERERERERGEDRLEHELM